MYSFRHGATDTVESAIGSRLWLSQGFPAVRHRTVPSIAFTPTPKLDGLGLAARDPFECPITAQRRRA